MSGSDVLRIAPSSSIMKNAPATISATRLVEGAGGAEPFALLFAFAFAFAVTLVVASGLLLADTLAFIRFNVNTGF